MTTIGTGMSNTYEIKHRWTGGVVYAGGGESLRDVVVQAVNDGASLAGAYLADSNLAGAYLAGANLVDAYLAGANLTGARINNGHALIGKRPVLQLGPIGSRCALLSAYLTDAGVMIRAGCFFGTLDEFRDACIETHGESVHGREYAAAITLIETHAELWSQEVSQ